MDLTTKVAFWQGERVLTFQGSWPRMPDDNILWVDLRMDKYKHRLIGADGYWVHGNRYGCTYEDAQPRFGGLACATWEVSEQGVVFLGERPPPSDAYIIVGIELDDDLWVRVVERYG